MRARRFSLKLLLALHAIVFSLAVFEAGTRIFARVGPTLLVKDSTIGKRFAAGFSGRTYVPEAGREVFLRFNREGFRGSDVPETPPPGTRRVAVIGDSMTAAVAVDEEHTFVRLLEDRLRLISGSRWETLNFGVSSASTGQELVYYRQVASRYRPEVVICAFFSGNDLADNSVQLTRAPRLYFDFDARGELRLASLGPRASPVNDWLDQHSRFYVWQKVAVAAVRSRWRAARSSLDVGYRIFETREDERLAHAWRITERLLATYRDEVEAHGSHFVVAVLPCAQQVYDDVWEELVSRSGGIPLDREKPERRLSSIGERHGIRVVSLTPAFRRAARHARGHGGSADLFLNHRHHFSEAGHAVAAEVLLPIIQELSQKRRPS